MKNTVFYTEQALDIIVTATEEAKQGNQVMVYYHLGRLDSFLYMLNYPAEFNHVFDNILTLLNKNLKF